MSATAQPPSPGSPRTRPLVGITRTRRARRRSPHAVGPPIQAVTFDVGGTLIGVWPSVGHVYAEVAALHGFNGLSPTDLNRRFVAAWRAARRFRHSRSGWSRLVEATFRGLTDRPPNRTFFADLYARFASPGVWRIFSDVRPALDALAARGLKLAIVSNWDQRLRPLLEQLKLAAYFQTIVVSCEVGAAKPSAAIFRRAARRLGLPPKAILHVGDDFAKDACGARAAGLSALWLRRSTPSAGAGGIRSLRELC